MGKKTALRQKREMNFILFRGAFENSLEKCKQMKEEWFSSQKRKNGDRKSPSRRYDIKSLNSKEELEEIQVNTLGPTLC